jgi:tetratricopeptide (TPR) repeat protein
MVEMLHKSDRIGTAFPHALIILVTVGLGVGTGWARAGQDPETQLEAAIHQEVVLGDLKGAVEQYEAILAQPGSRISMARALLQLGQCLEKLGRRTEAQNAYTRIIREYGDQSEVVNQARRWLVWEDSFSGPRNLKFEQGVSGKAPPGWFVTAPPKDADQWAELRRSGCRSNPRSNHGCAVMLTPGNAPIQVGGLQQTFGALAYRGKTIRLTAWIRVEAVDPDDRAQMWLSVDRTKSLMEPPVQSGDWTRREILTRVDDAADFIRFGFIAYGRGRAWVDDISVETVPAETDAGESRR